ncbi:MAG TPA: CBS domain-containing protein [Polyangiaceae bacterium]|nr:CBS domain-containing protein [Polyangiaceae bacterium]
MAQRVADLDFRRAVVVDPMDDAADAHFLAVERGVHHMLVAHEGALLGTVCRCELDTAFDGDSVGRRMQAPLAWACETDLVETAAALVLASGAGCLPVLNAADELVGMLTRSDLQRLGILPGERGVDCCASCGREDCSLCVTCPEKPAFCFDCLEQVRSNGVRELYFTLGGGD